MDQKARDIEAKAKELGKKSVFPSNFNDSTHGITLKQFFVGCAIANGHTGSAITIAEIALQDLIKNE